MAENDYTPGSMDVSDQKATYHTFMKMGMEWGAPFSMALAAFFTSLLVGAGILGGILTFVLVLAFCHFFVKMFLSH